MKQLKEHASELVEVARDAGANDVIVEVADATTNQIRFSSFKIDSSNWWRERHAIAFVAVGKRTMSTDIRDLSDARRQVAALVGMAKLTPENKEYAGIATGRFKYTRSRVDPKVASIRDPSRYVHEAIAGSESYPVTDCGGTMFVRRSSVGIASSGGALAEDEHASIDLSVRAFSQPEASGHSVCLASRISALKARETGERAGELAMKARDPVQGDEGKFDLILEPLCLGSLMNSTSGMMGALDVEIGASMYAKKIGKKVASDIVTIADDPTLSSMSQRAFDHEGMPTRRNVVVKNGVLKTYLHNTSTAKRFKTKSTASAGPLIPTTFSMAAQPIAFHIDLEPGDWKLDEMIEDTKSGIYLNHTWYTRFQNSVTGDFSTIPRDAILRIKDGEVVGAAKNIRISDNLLDFWKRVDAIAKKQEEIYWWDEAMPPSHMSPIRVRGMNITRSS